jgi:hypothetical protein
MSELTKHDGGCHCGQVRYQVDIDLTGQMATCNCSICSKTGAIMAFVPATAFTLVSGTEVLRDYQFNKKHVHHEFCTVCGVRSFSHGAGKDGTEMYMVNVRCIDGVDLEGLKIMTFDGKSL